MCYGRRDPLVCTYVHPPCMYVCTSPCMYIPVCSYLLCLYLGMYIPLVYVHALHADVHLGICMELMACVWSIQRIRATVDTVERKQLLMDLNVSKTLDCPYTIKFYGALFREVYVCVCLFVYCVGCWYATTTDHVISCYQGRRLDLHGADG